MFGSWTKKIIISEEKQDVKRNEEDHTTDVFFMLKKNCVLISMNGNE